jgi:hypothetical protein
MTLIVLALLVAGATATGPTLNAETVYLGTTMLPPISTETRTVSASTISLLSYAAGTLLGWVSSIVFYILRPFYLSGYWILHLMVFMPATISYRMLVAIMPVAGFLIVAAGVGVCIGGSAAWIVQTAAELGWGERSSLPLAKPAPVITELPAEKTEQDQPVQKKVGYIRPGAKSRLSHRRPLRHRQDTITSKDTSLSYLSSDAASMIQRERTPKPRYPFYYSRLDTLGRTDSYADTTSMTGQDDQYTQEEDAPEESFPTNSHDDVYMKPWRYTEDQILVSDEDDEDQSEVYTSQARHSPYGRTTGAQVHVSQVHKRPVADTQRSSTYMYRPRADTETSIASSILTSSTVDNMLYAEERPKTPAVANNTLGNTMSYRYDIGSDEEDEYTESDHA